MWIGGKLTGENRLKNLASLVAIQASNAVMPLLIFPYVLYAYGDQKYALYILAEVFSVYLLTLILFNFETDGVSRLATIRSKEYAKEISLLYSEVLFVRLVLFSIGLPIVCGLAAIHSSELALLVLCWSLLPLSAIFQANWFNLGVGDNSQIAKITLYSRCFSVVAVYLVSKQSDNIIYSILAIGISNFAASGVMMFCTTRRHRIAIRFIGVKWIYNSLKSGVHISLANFGVILYRESNVAVLTMVGCSADHLAAYSLAEKFTKVLQAIARPINQLFMVDGAQQFQRFKKGQIHFLSLIKKILFPQYVVCLALFLMIIIIYLIGFSTLNSMVDEEYVKLTWSIMLTMSIAFVFGVSNFMLGMVGLASIGQRVFMLKAILFAGGLSLLTCYHGGVQYGVYGGAFAFVVAEFVLLVMILGKCFNLR